MPSLFKFIVLIVLSAFLNKWIAKGPVNNPPQASLDGEYKWQYYKRFIDVITVIVIIIGLYFAWDQAKKLSDSINLSTWLAITNENLELDNLLASNSDIQPYIYDNCNIKEGDKNYQRVRAVTYEMLDFYNSFVTADKFLRSRVPEDLADIASWETTIRENFEMSPFMCKAFGENEQDYGKELRSIGDQVCKSAALSPKSKPLEKCPPS